MVLIDTSEPKGGIQQRACSFVLFASHIKITQYQNKRRAADMHVVHTCQGEATAGDSACCFQVAVAHMQFSTHEGYLALQIGYAHHATVGFRLIQFAVLVTPGGSAGARLAILPEVKPYPRQDDEMPNVRKRLLSATAVVA